VVKWLGLGVFMVKDLGSIPLRRRMILSDIKGSLIWDSVEDVLECIVKADECVIWI